MPSAAKVDDPASLRRDAGWSSLAIPPNAAIRSEEDLAIVLEGTILGSRLNSCGDGGTHRVTIELALLGEPEVLAGGVGWTVTTWNPVNGLGERGHGTDGLVLVVLFTDTFDVRHPLIQLMVMSIMFCALVMAAAVPEAFRPPGHGLRRRIRHLLADAQGPPADNGVGLPWNR